MSTTILNNNTPSLFDEAPVFGPNLSQSQQNAYRLLKQSQENLFITGGAGTGKSFLIRRFLESVEKPDRFPLLASTGAAAVLIGGRTFHSFFGLGIFEGGLAQTVEKALSNKRVVTRIKRIDGFVLDEVSMISGLAFAAAEQIARLARDSTKPWGGLRVIAVGDFGQLPPVSKNIAPNQAKDWAFLNPAWEESGLHFISLNEIMRSAEDPAFCSLLNDVRCGVFHEGLKDFLEWRTPLSEDENFTGTHLFARRTDVERLNEIKLKTLRGEATCFPTEYSSVNEFALKSIQSQAPIPPQLFLKLNALIMIRQNDPQGRWVNGSLGFVRAISSGELEIELLNKRVVRLQPSRFSVLDADGKELAAACNFPIHLAYAITIHKAQGTTLDKALVNLNNLWEPGQAYVAMSRVRRADDLFISTWSANSFKIDPHVQRFYENNGRYSDEAAFY